MRKARAKASDYCDKSAELRTCGGTVADTCDRDSTRQISAGQRFSPTSLTCPAVKPSYRSSQLVCPGTARESPREGDHTHTCLKCKKLEELRQTDRAAQNPESDAPTHERAQAHGSWEGGQCGGRGDRKAHHNSRNSKHSCRTTTLTYQAQNTPQHPLRRINSQPKKNISAEAMPQNTTVSYDARATQHPKLARTKEGTNRPRASGPKSREDARGASTVYPGRMNPVAQHISGGRREVLPSKRG